MCIEERKEVQAEDIKNTFNKIIAKNFTSLGKKIVRCRRLLEISSSQDQKRDSLCHIIP
jgi:hypothetical protein